MPAAIINIAEVTESNAKSSPEHSDFDIIALDSTGRKISKASIIIDETDDTPSIDSPSLESPNDDDTKNVDSNLNPEIVGDRVDKNETKEVSIDKTSTRKIKKKYRHFLDSDSEEDENSIASSLNQSDSDKESSDKNVPATTDSAVRGKKSIYLVDSDSDEDKTLVETNTGNVGNGQGSGNEDDASAKTAATKSTKSRFRTLVDTDSADEDESKNLDSPKSNDGIGSPDEDGKINLAGKKNNSKINTIVDTESEYEENSDNSSPPVKNKKLASNRKSSGKADKIKEKSRFSALVDTDSEDDTQRNNVEQSFNEEKENGVTGKKSGKTAKKRTGSVRAAKDEAMRQIHSETQRLIRSSAVSLPYHRPKQRSLEDFLNRKKFIPILPEGLTIAAKVKMSSEIVGKVLEEKEKEAELFYKSSDSEDEITAGSPVNVNPTSTCTHVQQIAIEETQRIAKNDMQNAHNKKEIMKQGTLEIGVSRKLFLDEPRDSMTSDQSTKIGDCEESPSLEPRKNMKETKHGMRNGNAPRKLFTGDCDEVIDSSIKDDGSSMTIVRNDDTESSEPRKDTEIQLESIDEGIHSMSRINEVSPSSDCGNDDSALKLHDSALSDPDCREIDESNANDNASKADESSKISGTPFISGTEYAELNEREKCTNRRKDPTDGMEIVNVNSDDSAFGHVYGLPPPDIDEENSSRKKMACTKKKLHTDSSSACPRLRGTPGMIIDFSDDFRPNEEGVKTLVDRFMRHSTVKTAIQGNSPVTVLRTEKLADGLKVTEEILPYKLPINDPLHDKELQKPGAKYKRLRMDLMERMSKKRDEEWRLKEQREKNEEENLDDIEEDYDDEETDVKLADDELQDSTEESEPDEADDDVTFEKPKKQKSRQFADDEAEVSGEDEADGDDEEEEEFGDEVECARYEKENISLRVDDDDDDTNDNFSDKEDTTLTKFPRSSRIVRAFEDDSNSKPDEPVVDRGRVLERTRTDVDMFETENDRDDWSSDPEAEFPPSQILPRDRSDSRSQLCKTPLTAINALRFVSPITQLTALNCCNESPKDSPASIDASLVRRSRISVSSIDKTPISIGESPISCDNSDKRFGFQKKLFDEPSGMVNDDELMGLCSGKFTNVETNYGITINPAGIISNERVTETQLLDVCSGTFLSQNLDYDGHEDTREHSTNENSEKTSIERDVNLNSDSARQKETSHEATPWTLKVDSSSDDNDNFEQRVDVGKTKILKKKKVRQLKLSDDDEDDEEASDEEIFEETKISNDKYVDYDSEENEVVVIPKRDIKKAAADFLEAEAELSESEWGSEDEDEKDLDKLEFEEGDDEEIDEKQMRDQLGRIHMRQVQDDDQREVRMLQELLFDDGDLHTDGGGRERKFKWKNIDKLGEDDNLGPRNNDGNENGDPLEEENDLEWRRERIEREKFIEDNMKLSTDEVTDDLADDSQVFKLGIKALKRGKISQNSQKELDLAMTKPIVPRTVLDLVDNQSLGQNTRILHKAVTRGSFLARGDECLARLAVHIKNSSETTIVARTKPKNFVFTHISPSVEERIEKEEENSKIEDSSGNSKAKKRKSTVGITPRSTKKAKLNVTRPAGKKLF